MTRVTTPKRVAVVLVALLLVSVVSLVVSVFNARSDSIAKDVRIKNQDERIEMLIAEGAEAAAQAKAGQERLSRENSELLKRQKQIVVLLRESGVGVSPEVLYMPSAETSWSRTVSPDYPGKSSGPQKGKK